MNVKLPKSKKQKPKFKQGKNKSKENVEEHDNSLLDTTSHHPLITGNVPSSLTTEKQKPKFKQGKNNKSKENVEEHDNSLLDIPSHQPLVTGNVPSSPTSGSQGKSLIFFLTIDLLYFHHILNYYYY